MGQAASSASTPTSDGEVEFFEGTEKRIEMDFSGEGDLRSVPREEWEEVVRLSQTVILHSKTTLNFTSFLLSESSLIVYPGKVILKTCGRTVPLNSVDRLLAIGKGIGMEPEWLCYSRKNFLKPNEQPEQHRSKEAEMDLCRKSCGCGDCFVLGPLTGDHWLLYDANFQNPDCSNRGDFSVDIMMYDLPADVQRIFFTSEPEGSEEGARVMTEASGLGAMAASIGGEVDDYCFSPCGYSCNVHAGNAYFMVHATPQEGCSYASFETNFGSAFGDRPDGDRRGPLNELIQRVLDAFRPEKLTITLFVDGGAMEFIGNAPFEAAAKDYRRKSTNSYHFEHDYVSTVASYVRRAGPSDRSLSSP